jgi:hypothetical protein
MAKFYRCFIKNFVFYHRINYQVNEENKTLYLDHKMLRSLGSNQVEVHGSTNFNTFKLVVIVSCAHICIIVGNGCNVGTKLS